MVRQNILQSDFYYKSVPEVESYFLTGVLESEFWAYFIWPLGEFPLRILNVLKTQNGEGEFPENGMNLMLIALCGYPPN